MIIYKDIFTGNELLSDAYKIVDVDDFLYEVNAKNMVVDPLGNVNIGANPSAEEQDEQLDDTTQTVIDVVYTFRLRETTFNKASFTTYIKMYLKKLATEIEKRNPDRVKEFQSKATKHIGKLLKNINEYDFYTGESVEEEGMIVLKGYREDQITPYFIYFKDGLEEERM